MSRSAVRIDVRSSLCCRWSSTGLLQPQLAAHAVVVLASARSCHLYAAWSVLLQEHGVVMLQPGCGTRARIGNQSAGRNKTSTKWVERGEGGEGGGNMNRHFVGSDALVGHCLSALLVQREEVVVELGSQVRNRKEANLLSQNFQVPFCVFARQSLGTLRLHCLSAGTSRCCEPVRNQLRTFIWLEASHKPHNLFLVFDPLLELFSPLIFCTSTSRFRMSFASTALVH